eukprot:356895-Chlamydomonas_euryale.AAC.1
MPPPQHPPSMPPPHILHRRPVPVVAVGVVAAAPRSGRQRTQADHTCAAGRHVCRHCVRCRSGRVGSAWATG